MKIKGSSGIALAAAALVMAFCTNAPAQQRNSRHQYADDTIVRDLKAGKLTVREAQMLENRRHRSAAPKVSALKPRSAKPVKIATSRKATLIHRQKSRKPIRHLTVPARKSKGRPPHQRRTAHAQAHGGTAVALQSGPVRKTAVRYIR